MIGLAVQLTRLCIGLLTLITRLLALVAEQAAAMLARQPPASGGRAAPDASIRPEPASPSRRRAYTAPPRQRGGRSGEAGGGRR